jgi:hypothetical protein
MRLLAEKADELMSLHLPQQHDVVAAIQHDGQSEETTADVDTVTAIRGKNGGKKGNCNKRKQKKQQNHSISPSTLDKSPLGWAHIRYGDKAYNCMKPCAWPEN